MSFGETLSNQHATYWLRTVGLCLASLAVAVSARADKLRLSDCPVPVRETIEANLMGGKVDHIKEIRINDHVLYLVEIDFRRFKDARLYVSGDGTLRKTVIEIRLQELPDAVLLAVERLVNRRGQIEEIEREIIEGHVRYRVEIEQPKQADKIVVFEEDGSISLEK